MRVAVIGAGSSGLSSIKACLEAGLDPVCFERSGHLGGLWRYREDVEDGQGSVMKSTVINTSKEMMSFSDFQIPAHFPIYMHNTQVYEYYRMYAERFGLLAYIQYNTEVMSVRKAQGFVENGQWLLCTKDKTTQEVTSQVFDAVMVCTGHHANRYQPKFAGMDTFKGKFLHSHDYRHPAGFEDKRVVVVGIGNSGGDIANELSRVASQVFLSTRQGTWIWNRVAKNGLPVDMLGISRVFERIWSSELFWVMNKVVKRKLNQRFDHDLYSLRPNYDPLQQHPMVNDELPNRIICGAVKIKTDVKKTTESGVEFVDGTFEDDIDVIVTATGYTFGFPFIDKEVIDVQKNEVNLYLNTFLPDLERPTIAIIGCVQGYGALTPVAEIQGRAICQVFKAQMWKDIRKKRARNARRFAKSRRHTIQVQLVEFVDSMADLCGCAPDFWHLWTRDPLLAFKVAFGPLTPYQFRLYGPNQWPGARAAIMTQWDRTYAPLQTRPLPKTTNWSYQPLLVLAVFVCFVLIFMRMFF